MQLVKIFIFDAQNCKNFILDAENCKNTYFG